MSFGLFEGIPPPETKEDITKLIEDHEEVLILINAKLRNMNTAIKAGDPVDVGNRAKTTTAKHIYELRLKRFKKLLHCKLLEDRKRQKDKNRELHDLKVESGCKRKYDKLKNHADRKCIENVHLVNIIKQNHPDCYKDLLALAYSRAEEIFVERGLTKGD